MEKEDLKIVNKGLEDEMVSGNELNVRRSCKHKRIQTVFGCNRTLKCCSWILAE